MEHETKRTNDLVESLAIVRDILLSSLKGDGLSAIAAITSKENQTELFALYIDVHTMFNAARYIQNYLEDNDLTPKDQLILQMLVAEARLSGSPGEYFLSDDSALVKSSNIINELAQDNTDPLNTLCQDMDYAAKEWVNDEMMSKINAIDKDVQRLIAKNLLDPQDYPTIDRGAESTEISEEEKPRYIDSYIEKPFEEKCALIKEVSCNLADARKTLLNKVLPESIYFTEILIDFYEKAQVEKDQAQDPNLPPPL